MLTNWNRSKAVRRTTAFRVQLVEARRLTVVAKTLLTVVGGIALGGLAAACATHQMGAMGGRDVESPITLRPAPKTSDCTLSAKESFIVGNPDKWIRLKISNYCGQSQEVRVGNFRPAGTSGPDTTDCRSAMHGGAPPIFQQDDERRRTADLGPGSPSDPSEEKINLKLKKAADLPSGDEYDFDVCLGGRKADPRLIIER